jgi:hypothetical protein
MLIFFIIVDPTIVIDKKTQKQTYKQTQTTKSCKSTPKKRFKIFMSTKIKNSNYNKILEAQ